MLGSSSFDTIMAFIRDYNTSLRFYKEIIGLNPVWEDAHNRNAAFRVGHQLLMIQEGAGGAAEGGFYLNFTVPDIWNLQENLLEAGVPCSPVQDAGEFQWVTFNDPDGNRLGLVELTPDYLPRLETYLGRKLG